MSTVKNYLSLVKFSHTIFAMPFAMIGFTLAIKSQQPGSLNDAIGWSNDSTNFLGIAHTIRLLVLVVLCMVFARSAAMAFNRYLDRSFDALNPRTAIREIPAGIISANSALWFTIACCILFIVCCLFINPLVSLLAPVALFVVLFYSYTKRFTALCHLVLGLGLSLAPIGAYLAVTAHFHVLPVLLSFAVLFWVSGFDIIYALQDEAFDRNHHLHSIPAALGKVNALRVSRLLHVCAAICVVVVGLTGHLHWLYWLGVAIFCGMLIYQQSIVRPDDLSKVNIAFMTANGIASVVFAVFVIGDLLLLN